MPENSPFKVSDKSDLEFFSNTYKGLLLLPTGWESGTISNTSSKWDINLVSIIMTKKEKELYVLYIDQATPNYSASLW